jgi:hypothetical protein
VSATLPLLGQVRRPFWVESWLVVARVLITGMSGTGKSTVLVHLAERGHQVVDADDEGWSHEVPTADGLSREQLWREDRMDALLAGEPSGSLFIAGCASNQGRFYDRFDAVVLLSVPVEVSRSPSSAHGHGRPDRLVEATGRR